MATASELCSRAPWTSEEFSYTTLPPVIHESDGPMKGLYTCSVRHCH